MAMSTIQSGPVHQAREDNVKRQLDTTSARQGDVSGRVITVLITSTVLLGVIFAVIWLVGVYG